MSEENKTVFDLGDIVMAFGINGIVISIEDGDYYPIKVRFNNGNYASFGRSGKLEIWHLEPSLKLIEKAKKKVKKKFWFYIGESDIKNLYIAPEILYLYKPKEQKNCQVAEIELEVEE